MGKREKPTQVGGERGENRDLQAGGRWVEEWLGKMVPLRIHWNVMNLK